VGDFESRLPTRACTRARERKQLAREGPHVGEAPCWLERHAALDDGREAARRRQRLRGRGQIISRRDAIQTLRQQLRAEWIDAGRAFVQDDAHRILIRARSQRLSAHRFRRHVQRRSKQVRRAGRAERHALVPRFGDAEVEQLGLDFSVRVAREEDVAGLEVTMDALLEEALAALVTGHHAHRQHLERDGSPQARVLGAIDPGHPTVRDALVHDVFAEAGAFSQRAAGRCPQ
jgi:hypothetical protein